MFKGVQGYSKMLKGVQGRTRVCSEYSTCIDTGHTGGVVWAQPPLINFFLKMHNRHIHISEGVGWAPPGWGCPPGEVGWAPLERWGGPPPGWGCGPPWMGVPPGEVGCELTLDAHSRILGLCTAAKHLTIRSTVPSNSGAYCSCTVRTALLQQEQIP